MARPSRNPDRRAAQIAEEVYRNQPRTSGSASNGLPTGGSTGQALVKSSGTDYDTEWGDVAGAGIGLDGGAPDTVFGDGLVDGGSP